VLGEGAGALLLEEREAALARGARIYAELRGYGAAGDAHHITSPADDGSGALRVMALALEEGGLEPGHVAYVNAHATSTPAGDVIEARAIDRLLLSGGSGGGGGRPLVSSTKGAIGHLLGAAGAVEAVAAVMALHTVRAAAESGRGGEWVAR
jgi:3-oxoacyl-[acyl-carrier-protein] synthase II